MRNLRIAIVYLIVFLAVGILGGCASQNPSSATLVPVVTQTPARLPSSGAATTGQLVESPTAQSHTPVYATQPADVSSANCSTIEHLALDGPEAQQIVDEFVANYKTQYPTEYMGMAILHSVDRLGEWAVVQGSVSGEGKDVITARQTAQGFQIAERYTITAPLASFDSPENIIPDYFLHKLPEAPTALFTCLDQSWLLGEPIQTADTIGELAYISTREGSTEGLTGLFTIKTDGSPPALIFSGEMLVVDLAASPDGQWIAFAGCPGSLANDCLPGHDLDIMLVPWEGGEVQTLTGSPGNDRHPSWSPDGRIAFDSDRSGTTQIYTMQADGGDQRLLSAQPGWNSEPKWSPDGAWIAYHCQGGSELRICLVTPEGQASEKSIAGTTPVWSPLGQDGSVWLAYLCFQGSQSDLCKVHPDGTEWSNLTISPWDEHSPAWSPDGDWLAFISNQEQDVDLYKLCVTCPERSDAVRLTDEPPPVSWPTWSPDGSRLAYVAGQTLMLIKPDRSETTFLAGQVLLPPIWRP